MYVAGQKTSKGYPVMQANTGEVVTHAETREKAEANARARNSKLHKDSEGQQGVPLVKKEITYG